MTVNVSHTTLEEVNHRVRSQADDIYRFINLYCKENKIKLTYDDNAERFVKAIEAYLIASGN